MCGRAGAQSVHRWPALIPARASLPQLHPGRVSLAVFFLAPGIPPSKLPRRVLDMGPGSRPSGTIHPSLTITPHGARRVSSDCSLCLLTDGGSDRREAFSDDLLRAPPLPRRGALGPTAAVGR
ncbi:hypothetical protein GY45DRAFT_296107 [Cubamyces sp. BRFM 1775]|nr:hypothetical protein GY45DRAFT_296107 [Cubamyces sp. BRFM 1775]